MAQQYFLSHSDSPQGTVDKAKRIIKQGYPKLKNYGVSKRSVDGIAFDW